MEGSGGKGGKGKNGGNEIGKIIILYLCSGNIVPLFLTKQKCGEL